MNLAPAALTKVFNKKICERCRREIHWQRKILMSFTILEVG